MKTKAEELFYKIERLYENIYNLLEGFQQASTANVNDIIAVQLRNVDDSIETKNINSFQKLQQELTRLDANYKSLISADNLAYILGSDGSISQVTKTNKSLSVVFIGFFSLA